MSAQAYEPQTITVGQACILVAAPDPLAQMLLSIGMLTPEDYVSQAPRSPGVVVGIVDATENRFRIEGISPDGETREFVAMLVGDAAAKIPDEVLAEATSELARERARASFSGERVPLFGELRNEHEEAVDLDDLDALFDED